MSKLDDRIFEKLNVDQFNINYKNLVPPKPDKNNIKEHYQIASNHIYQIDLMTMPFFNKFNYIFVIVNLRTKVSDVVPLRSKDSSSVSKALELVLDRNIIENKPEIIYADRGSEFNNKIFISLCKENDIQLIFTRVKNKNQNAIVEMQNNFYGKYLMRYIGYIEQQKNKKYHNWVDILDTVRDELNKWAKENYPKYNNFFGMQLDGRKNKYNVGDLVYIKSDYPRRTLTEQPEHGYNYRHGDLRFLYAPHKISGIIRNPGRNLRYSVTDDKGAKVFGNYLEKDLLPYKDFQH